jgi:NAD-dependent DNA ligase
MKDLKVFLDECSRRYYNGDELLIPDEVFDRLADSISYDKLGANPIGKTASHIFPMWSLDKFYPGEGKEAPLSTYRDNDKSTSPKVDGAAISLLYVKGELVQALTRGTGEVGQVVTEKFLATKLVPHRIKTSDPMVQVIGELCAPSHVENARNYAAGSLNLKDINEFTTRALTFFAYGIQPYPTDDYEEDIKTLRRMGFGTIHDRDIHLVYPTDGLVVRLRSNVEFQSLGYTSKHPRGAYAIKERAEAVETTIIDVVWQVGKSGKVTPVAILEPVMIGDAVVSRATLNNQKFIEDLGIEIGDRVFIIRAGEIIPCIVGKVDQ